MEAVEEAVDHGRLFVIVSNVDRVLENVVGLPVLAVSVTAGNPIQGIATRVAIGVQKPNGDLGGVVPHNVVDHARRNAAEIVATRVHRLASIRLFPKPKQHLRVIRIGKTRTRSITRKIPPLTRDHPPLTVPRRKVKRRLQARKNPRKAKNIHRTATAVIRTPATTKEGRRRKARARKRRSNFNAKGEIVVSQYVKV